MTPLEELRATQRNDLTFASDAAFTAFLSEVAQSDTRLDLAPTTEIEIRHLARTERNAA